MRKIIALLLAAAMAFSLVIVAGATEETAKQTAELKVTCTDVTADGVATFTISIVAPASGVAALQFTLTPENMTQVDDGVSWPETEKLTNVFNLNEIDTNKKGNFGYTKDSSGTGKFIAYGGDASTGRCLTDTVQLLTIQYRLNADAESGTLTISDFKACQSGSQAIDQTTAYICTAPESVEAKRPASGGSTTLKGDVNGDGTVNGVDTNMIYRYVMGYIDESEFTEQQKANADVNSDGNVNGVDTNMVYRYVMGYIDSF